MGVVGMGDLDMRVDFSGGRFPIAVAELTMTRPKRRRKGKVKRMIDSEVFGQLIDSKT